MLRLLVIVTLAAAAPFAPAAPEDALVVSAAISLTDALAEIQRVYQTRGGGTVQFNFGASNVLARQIANGAPVDLFISADEAQMTYALEHGAVDRADIVPVLRNRLAVIAPAGRGHLVTEPSALSGVRRIAIGDPSGVPVGVYARQYLEAAGLWESVRPKLLPLATARSVLSAAESGGVDAAIVYRSDLVAARGVELGYVVTGTHAPEIVYPAAIVNASTNRVAAGKFLAFLRSSEAARIFERYRFCPVYPPQILGPQLPGPVGCNH